ncbi:MAG: ABC transporter substrate-binding protein [Thermomicrobiales bacterium]
MLRTSRLWGQVSLPSLCWPWIAHAGTTSLAAQDDGSVLRQQITYLDVVDPAEEFLHGGNHDPAPCCRRPDAPGYPAADGPGGGGVVGTCNDDATQITFKLRPDLKYSDGSPVTAENFRYGHRAHL